MKYYGTDKYNNLWPAYLYLYNYKYDFVHL